MTDRNAWSGREDIADEMIRPDTSMSKPGQRERRLEDAMIATLLGNLWRREQRLTHEMSALLDVLADRA